MSSWCFSNLQSNLQLTSFREPVHSQIPGLAWSPNVVFCCPSPSISRFDMFYSEMCSEMLICSALCGYLCYHILPDSSNQSGHSLQTSFINKTFPPTELPISENPRRSADLKYLDQPIWHQQPYNGHWFLILHVWCMFDVMLLTCICMVLFIALVLHDWLIRSLH